VGRIDVQESASDDENTGHEVANLQKKMQKAKTKAKAVKKGKK